MVTIADFKKFVDGLLKPVTTKIGNVDARIKALLPSDSDEIFLYRDFQRLGKGLQREQLLDGVDNQRYIDVVEIIHNHLGWNQSAIKTFSPSFTPPKNFLNFFYRKCYTIHIRISL